MHLLIYYACGVRKWDGECERHTTACRYFPEVTKPQCFVSCLHTCLRISGLMFNYYNEEVLQCAVSYHAYNNRYNFRGEIKFLRLKKIQNSGSVN